MDELGVLIDIINQTIDLIVPYVILTLIAGYLLYTLVKWLREKKPGEALYLWIILVAIIAIPGGLLLFLNNVIVGYVYKTWPDVNNAKLPSQFAISVIWYFHQVVIWGVLLAFSKLVQKQTKKYGEKRGLYSYLGHLGALFTGWLLGRWIGMLFLSIPLIGLYYFLLSHVADVVIPVTDPDDKREAKNRFWLMFWYTWGAQYPVYTVKDHSGRDIETLIPGDFTEDYGAPGMIWIRSHQVVALTTGIELARVEGPGVVYTKRMERPKEVMDLRLQLRGSSVDAISYEGIHYKAFLFTAFQIDKSTWTPKQYRDFTQKNSNLLHGRKPEKGFGNFKYSPVRVRAALGLSSVDTTAKPTRWDEHVVSIVEEAARSVLSRRHVDNLWRPLPADGNIAMGGILKEMVALVEPQLRLNGVQAFVARVVNYDFKSGDEDQISSQQRATWRVPKEQQAIQTIFEGEARAEQLQEQALAYAQAALLNSFARSLQEARDIDENLPRRVIELRYISAIEEMLERQPAEEGVTKDEDLRTRLMSLKQRIQLRNS